MYKPVSSMPGDRWVRIRLMAGDGILDMSENEQFNGRGEHVRYRGDGKFDFQG